MKRNKKTGQPNRNLKSVLELVGISNLAFAKALDLDPSLISRYLSGERRLIAASAQMAAIADFILERCNRLQDIQWLTEQFHSVGLPTD
ncbi:MAG TPA: helix-turn-helix transcriptional regulator, partial [Flexilinea sp.]|nr:helix-turn-helix transcriptional regulator [Flexilinea sp.]